MDSFFVTTSLNSKDIMSQNEQAIVKSHIGLRCERTIFYKGMYREADCNK